MKDTSNLLSYNLWSGSEYSEDTSEIIPNGLTITPSSEFATIGEKSFKITRTGTNNYLTIYITNLLTNNKTYTVYIDVYSPTSTGSIILRDGAGTNSISYSAINSVQTVSLSKQFSTSSNCSIQLICSTGPVFIDNIRLVES